MSDSLYLLFSTVLTFSLVSWKRTVPVPCPAFRSAPEEQQTTFKNLI